MEKKYFTTLSIKTDGAGYTEVSQRDMRVSGYLPEKCNLTR